MQKIKRIIDEGTVITGSLPDIDIDFSGKRRGEIFEYLASQYDNVARVCNFSYLKPRTAIKTAARVLGKHHSIVNQLNKLIDPIKELSFSLEKSEVQSFIKTNQLEKVIELAGKLEGIVDHYNVHAAAVVISSENMNMFSPLMSSTDDSGLPITQYDMRGCEDVGLVKYDFLGITTLDVIDECAKMAGIKIEDIPLEDPAVYDFFGSGADLFGIFQFEKSLTQQICVGSKPRCLNDLSAINAVIRPGALHSGFHKDYVRGSKSYKLPVLEETLKETKGILLYQEQLMSLAQHMAGLTEEQADDLRKGIGKKKHEIIKHYQELFTKGCLENGYTAEDANEVWEWFDAAKDYAFNKSHSILYSMISYYCAWLRVNYPVEYFTAFLNAYSDNREKMIAALKRLSKMKFSFLLPDINKSGIGFTNEHGKVRVGLSNIKGIGETAAKKILDKREEGYDSLVAFLKRKGATPKTTQILVQAGCFDELMPRYYALKHLKVENVPDREETEEERGKMEKDLLGIFLTKNPLASMDAFNDGQNRIVSDLMPYDVNRKVTFCGVISDVSRKTAKSTGKEYATCVISDPYAEVNGIVFSKTLPTIGTMLAEKETPMLVTGYLNIDSWQDEDDEVFEDEDVDVFSRGKVTILDLEPIGGKTPSKIYLKVTNSIPKKELAKMLQYLGAAQEKQQGSGLDVSEVYIDGKNTLKKTPYKLHFSDSMKIYLNKTYGIVVKEGI